MESGRFGELEKPIWSSGQCPSEQTEMSENIRDHRRVFNRGDDLLSATVAMVVLSRMRTHSGLKWQLKHLDEL